MRRLLINDKLFQAQKWLSSHTKVTRRFLGKWIAVSKDGIEGSANSIDSLERKIGEGRNDLLITKIPANAGAICCY